MSEQGTVPRKSRGSHCSVGYTDRVGAGSSSRRGARTSQQSGTVRVSFSSYCSGNEEFRRTGPFGSLTLSNIIVELNRDFIDRNSHYRSEEVFYFCIILRSGEQVLHSAIISSEDAVKRGFIEVAPPMALKNLPRDFTASLDVYSFVCPSSFLTNTFVSAHYSWSLYARGKVWTKRILYDETQERVSSHLELRWTG